MVKRLGNVLYWLGCIFAVLFGILGLFMLEGDLSIISFGAAFVVWVVGFALRYILRG